MEKEQCMLSLLLMLLVVVDYPILAKKTNEECVAVVYGNFKCIMLQMLLLLHMLSSVLVKLQAKVLM
jgi:hypothetical protein